jgi:uncharacterized protein
MADQSVDLERLGLRSGEAVRLELSLEPAVPVVGGQRYPLEGSSGADARIEVSRTTSGYALRLASELSVAGPCSRCLERAELPIAIEAREVDQPAASDEELRSPYVEEGILDATSWLHDAIVLALPDKPLCKPDCAGICEVCGVSLNDVDSAEHSHPKPLDPRFARLRELTGEADDER